MACNISLHSKETNYFISCFQIDFYISSSFLFLVVFQMLALIVQGRQGMEINSVVHGFILSFKVNN